MKNHPACEVCDLQLDCSFRQQDQIDLCEKVQRYDGDTDEDNDSFED